MLVHDYVKGAVAFLMYLLAQHLPRRAKKRNTPDLP